MSARQVRHGDVDHPMRFGIFGVAWLVASNGAGT